MTSLPALITPVYVPFHSTIASTVSHLFDVAVVSGFAGAISPRAAAVADCADERSACYRLGAGNMPDIWPCSTQLLHKRQPL